MQNIGNKARSEVKFFTTNIDILGYLFSISNKEVPYFVSLYVFEIVNRVTRILDVIGVG
jgi:hypothetical protein